MSDDLKQSEGTEIIELRDGLLKEEQPEKQYLSVENKKKGHLRIVLSEIGLNLFPISVITFFSIRALDIRFLIDFVRDGNIQLMGLMVAVSALIKIINKRVRKLFKTLLLGVILLESLEVSITYINHDSSITMSIIFDIVLLVVSCSLSILAQLQMEDEVDE
ncbi:MAG: hypothetical protein K5868_09940 [Lachnospiraceae bacterium]|nr:hypothetical protein [Lachnospiraceae bacterium]